MLLGIEWTGVLDGECIVLDGAMDEIERVGYCEDGDGWDGL